MNKLVFTLKRDFNDDILLIANNHKDLEDYLNNNYNFFKVVVNSDFVKITELEGFNTEFANLEWVKHI